MAEPGARDAGTSRRRYLNGEIVLLGRQHRVPTPVNEACCAIAVEALRDRLPNNSVPPSRFLS